MNEDVAAHPKKVLLFGRMGCGKSTVANVLVEGGIEPVTFQSSSGVDGCTREIQTGSGRGWTVVDTVGLGEATGGNGSSLPPVEGLQNFLRIVKGEYSHIIYVIAGDERFSEADSFIWFIFKLLFAGAEDAFVVLYTKKDHKWLEQEMQGGRIPPYFMQHPILAFNIPPVYRRIPWAERRNVTIRRDSIKKLEDELEALFRNRNYENAVPNIAKMDDAQTEEESKSIIRKVIEMLRRWFSADKWPEILALFSNLIGVTVAIVSSFNL